MKKYCEGRSTLNVSALMNLHQVFNVDFLSLELFTFDYFVFQFFSIQSDPSPLSTSIYIYIYIYICVCVCVCVCKIDLWEHIFIYTYAYVCVCARVCAYLLLSTRKVRLKVNFLTEFNRFEFRVFFLLDWLTNKS